MSRCCLVYPTWKQIGTVKWDGQPNREPLFAVERVQCPDESTCSYAIEPEPAFHYCREHALERLPKLVAAAEGRGPHTMMTAQYK